MGHMHFGPAPLDVAVPGDKPPMPPLHAGDYAMPPSAALTKLLARQASLAFTNARLTPSCHVRKVWPLGATLRRYVVSFTRDLPSRRYDYAIAGLDFSRGLRHTLRPAASQD